MKNNPLYIKKNNYLIEILKNGNNKILIKGYLPIEFETIDKKVLSEFNKPNFNSYEFIKKTWNFSEDSEKLGDLVSLKRYLFSLTRKIYKIQKEFSFFNKFSINKINNKRKELSAFYKMDLERREKELSSYKMDDISSGIFDPNEANSRYLFNSLKWNNWSEDTLNTDDELNYFLKIYLSFMYLKFEELTRFVYDIFYKSEKYIFLKDKIIVLNEIKELPNFLKDDLNDVYKKINMYANYYKHQTELPYDNNILDDFYIINCYMNILLSNLYSIFDYSIICQKIDDIHGEHEGITNPLGLTGFE